MTQKKELQLAYALAGILLVVSILSYGFAAFSTEPPEEPIRIMYRTLAGNVLFDHKAHFSPAYYGISCEDCHHHPSEEAYLISCGDCHQVVGEDEGVPEACLDCHDSDYIEGMEMSKSSDAAHAQCIDCHEEYGAGPVGCQACHVL